MFLMLLHKKKKKQKQQTCVSETNEVGQRKVGAFVGQPQTIPLLAIKVEFRC